MRILLAVMGVAVCIVAVIGCVSPIIPNSEAPAEHVFYVQAEKPWQSSGVFAERGDIVWCKAEGKWGDHYGVYGPEGNPEMMKVHFKITAPAFALIMKMSSQTNIAYFIGGETNITVTTPGELMFRCNISLPIDVTGQVKVAVTVAHDADKDGLSDYEEVNIWKTDPRNPDTNGNGFSDYEEVAVKRKKQEAKDPRRSLPAKIRDDYE